VVDGTDDSFVGRKLSHNDADCVVGHQSPSGHAGILRFDGQLMTVRPGASAMLSVCLHQPPPPAGRCPLSQAGPYWAPWQAWWGLQATEALKNLLGLDGL